MNAPSPMMAQFLEIKARHEDALLFYRMGDFYELFFDDAKAAAAALDIALTARGTHEGEPIPMCRVPAHSAEGYLLTLIRKGFRVAVCDQLEDPAEAKKRGSKSVVKRDVVRLVTPGTLTEDTLLEARRHNYLAAHAEIRGEGALAWVDISTGDFTVSAVARSGLPPMLARLLPREVLAADEGLRAAIEEAGAVMTTLGAASFDSEAGRGRLCTLLNVSSLDAFGQFGRAELAAMGAIADYLDLTQKGQLPLLRGPVREEAGGALAMDAATRRNLELTHALSGGRSGSLLATIDRTVTGGGARLLEARLTAPSCDLATIRARHEAVAALLDDTRLCENLRDALRSVPDLDRALSRLALDRGGPRDLAAVRDTLAAAVTIAAMPREDLPELLVSALASLQGHDDLAAFLDEALVASPPILARDGGFVAEGFDAELDETRQLRDEGRGVIASLQGRYAEQAGIGALKIKHNNVLGYFIETPATHAAKMMAPPLSETFIHRQTTANAVRFTTLDLAELEKKILNAGELVLSLEKAIFARLRAAVLSKAGPLGDLARALAEIDVAAALAELATREDWVRPEMESGIGFAIEAGRHPVVEAALRREGEGFIANDCDLSGEGKPVWLLTGPNMGGKSTFLRQNALMAVLAQAGAFVPARSARIGIVTQLFSRVGASDDLARGRSTFMVEMVETAAILNQAGPGALVILDEIGRGTATYDGLSIAWAVLEHLHDVNRCRALFATHYHELTALTAKLPRLANATTAVREWEGEVVFLHEVRPGAADRSYGVQVARLAGLPAAVIERARAVLEMLETGDRAGKARAEQMIDDIPLFRAAPPPPARTKDQLRKRLEETNPDTLSPRDALELIYELKALSSDTDK